MYEESKVLNHFGKNREERLRNARKCIVEQFGPDWDETPSVLGDVLAQQALEPDEYGRMTVESAEQLYQWAYEELVRPLEDERNRGQ